MRTFSLVSATSSKYLNLYFSNLSVLFWGVTIFKSLLLFWTKDWRGRKNAQTRNSSQMGRSSFL
jgi:hypothetical protein